jgi:hypothetical protein
MQTGKSTTDLIADLFNNYIPKYGDMETKIVLTVNLPFPEPINRRIEEIKFNSQNLCNCGKGSCPLECNKVIYGDSDSVFTIKTYKPATPTTTWFSPNIFGGREIAIPNDLKIENDDKTDTNTHIDPNSEEVD